MRTPHDVITETAHIGAEASQMPVFPWDSNYPLFTGPGYEHVHLHAYPFLGVLGGLFLVFAGLNLVNSIFENKRNKRS